MGETQIHVRALRVDDVDRLTTFFLSLTEKETYYYDPHPMDRANAERVCRTCAQPNVIRIVAVSSDAIAGFIHAGVTDVNRGHLGICILPSVQSKGLGTLLFEALIREAKLRGWSGLALNVHKENPRALRLYEKMGFVVEHGFMNPKQHVPQYYMTMTFGREGQPMPEALSVRELYCPSHFGNTYECALDSEMTELLSEGKFWGFNRFSDWFDTIDLYDVYTKDHGTHQLFNMPEAMWARKLDNFTIAHKLGYELALVITPNHVFSNQVTPETAATTRDLMFGQLVCPSKPGVTEMVVGNYRHIFKDFVKRGLQLHSISACPYDYGGCSCDACSPWIVAFGKLTLAIVHAAREVFGTHVDADLIGWWWSDDDHRAFTEWANREAPGEFASMAYHLPYGHTAYATRQIPTGCKERAFVHIGYGEDVGFDHYGHAGPTIATHRIEKTVAFLRERNAQGFMAYSEGQFDEINKALLAGLSSGRFATAADVLKTYARRHLSEVETEAWAAWLESMGDFGRIDARQARAEFDRLKVSARASWRLEALEDRVQMAEANAAVVSMSEWNAERLAAAKKFVDAKEHVFRRVWALGLQRHIFKFDSIVPAWFVEYKKVLGGEAVGHIGVNSKEA